MILPVLLVIAVLAGATTGVVAWLRSHDSAPLVVRCGAELNGTSWYLEPEQADNAALIAATALRRGLPARAVTIALATALQESKLRNLPEGDRDSVGLFQQRPSQGWGTVDQLMDPVYATNAFYDALTKVPGYQDMTITQAAQAVQRSAFPDAYAQHETRARAWASALAGYSPGAVTCTLGTAAPVTADVVLTRVARDLGIPATAAGSTVTLDVTALPGGDTAATRLGSAIAQWAVALAAPLGLAEVRVGDSTWTRADQWSTASSQVPTGQVVLVLAD